MPNNRDKNDFLEQVEKHQGIVHKVCFVYGRTPADREDLKQEIMLHLWKSYSSFAGRSGFSTWMYRVALNTAISFKRKVTASGQSQTEQLRADSLGQQPEYRDDLRDLRRMIAGLNDIEKAIIMQWLDERSYEEIADTMGMSVKNISVRLVRIKTRLAEEARQ